MMECTPWHRLTNKCPYCEALKREQQAARFVPVLECELELDEPRDFDAEYAAEVFIGATKKFHAAMSADAGSIVAPPESITRLREAWDALDQMRQDAVRQAIVELDYRMRHATRVEFADAVIAAVLDA